MMVLLNMKMVPQQQSHRYSPNLFIAFDTPDLTYEIMDSHSFFPNIDTDGERRCDIFVMGC